MRKKLVAALIILLIMVIPVIIFDTRDNSEKLLDGFTEYREARGLEVFLQTFPQSTENELLAFYETPDEKFGVIEFDNEHNLTSENELEDITVSALRGNNGEYVGVKHSKEKYPNIKKVDLYTEDNVLVDSFELGGNESLSFFKSLELPDPAYRIELINTDNEKVETVEFSF